MKRYRHFAIVVVPGIKYPANPPSIGNPATIGLRTGLFFLMMAISLTAMIGASLLSQRLAETYGRWNGWLAGAAFFLVIVLVTGFILPPINEVPEGFPAALLWRFRTVSLATETILWSTIGLLFGELTARSLGYTEARRVGSTALRRA